MRPLYVYGRDLGMKRWICAILTAFLLMGMPLGGFASEQERFDSMEELTSYLFYDCAYMLAGEVEFSYTSALDGLFSEFPWKMLHSCGMVDFDVSIDRTRRKVIIRNIEYYSGFKAAQAWEIEMLNLLDEDERTALAHAEAMVEEARQYAQSPYQVLLNLHDALSERVTYTPGDEEAEGWSIQDTAIGALNYGQAECDGYSDAFYLLATLAGFQVRLISGHSDSGDGDGLGAHMWNLLWWENGWYHVDVTWDDMDWAEDASMTNYPYLLLGSDMIKTHVWTEEYLVSHPQQYTDWDAYYYTADPSGLTYGAYYNTVRDACNYIVYKKRECGERNIHVMIDGDYEDEWETINEVLIDCGLTGSWHIWTKNVGEYSYIAIRIKS